MKLSVFVILFVALFTVSLFAADAPWRSFVPNTTSSVITPGKQIESTSTHIKCRLEEGALAEGVIIVHLEIADIQESAKLGVDSMSSMCIFRNYLEK